MLKYAHHVHYVVSNLEDFIAYMEKAFGMKPDSVDDYRERGRGLKKALYTVDKTMIDIIEPTDLNSHSGRMLRDSGPGILHVGWAVDDIEKAAIELAANGTKLSRDDAMRQSVRGYTEINIDRESSHGIWFQLCGYPEPGKNK